MIDDRDPFLTRSFAEQCQPAHASDFMAQFVNLMDRDRCVRRTYWIGTIVAGVIVAALLAPLIAQVAATAIGFVAAGIVATRSSLNFPMALLVACSIAVSFVPVIYLGVTRRW
jgi:uncharacterized membrane protein YhaH (DUF805 family)